MMKRCISWMLVLILMVGIVPIQIHADGNYRGSTPDGVTYEAYDGYVVIDGYEGTNGDVVIPSEIDGLPVTEISPWAFDGCNALNSIVIPDSVTSIGRQAFYYCENLSSVTILCQVSSINDEMFYGCRNLSNVTLPDELTCIGESVFSGCAALASIALPDSLTDIGSGAFYGCSSLTNITLPEGVNDIRDSTFCGCDSLTDIVIPGSVQTIGDYAFSGCSKMESITISEGVVSIGNGAFDFCHKLTNLSVPASVTSIDYRAFWYCAGLTSFDVDADNTEYCSRDGILYNKDMTTLIRCPNRMKTATIADTVTRVETYAFRDCEFLTEISIPEGVTYVGDRAFEGCSRLNGITIPGSVTDIGEMAFWGLYNVSGIEVDAENTEYCSQDGILYNKDMTTLICCPSGKQGSAEIPWGVTCIEDHAFAICRSLTDVTIPDSVASIGRGAFSRCEGITDIELPNSITAIGYTAFSYCSGLTEVTFDGNAPSFGEAVFLDVVATAYYPLGNDTWTEDVMQDHGGTITWKPHLNIGGLIDTIFWELIDGYLVISPSLSQNSDGQINPNSVSAAACRMRDYSNVSETPWYPYRAYIDCIIIESGVEYIGGNAFSGMERIDSVYIGADVSSIGSGAFMDCAAVEKVVFYGDAPTIGNDAFEGVTAAVSYPADNATWDDAALDAFGEEASFAPYEGELPAVPEPRDNPFEDVFFNTFFYDPVLWAVENGITTGATDTAFNPNGQCQRAQVVTFLWRAAGSPEPAVTENPFVDVEAGSFYEKAVLWAVEKGITTGTDETHFSPNMACNRATVVTFLYRAFEEPAVAGAENPFTDVPADSWYTAPVLWAVEEGITNGMGEGLFGSDTACNRAQIVTFLYRAYTE